MRKKAFTNFGAFYVFKKIVFMSVTTTLRLLEG